MAVLHEQRVIQHQQQLYQHQYQQQQLYYQQMQMMMSSGQWPWQPNTFLTWPMQQQNNWQQQHQQVNFSHPNMGHCFLFRTSLNIKLRP
jgi:hypothetical protein